MLTIAGPSLFIIVSKYLRTICAELGYKQLGPTVIYEDNASAIQMVNAMKPTDRSRHIDTQNFAIQEWKANQEITLSAIPGIINCSDAMTKALGWVLHSRRMMGHYGPPQYITHR